MKTFILRPHLLFSEEWNVEKDFYDMKRGCKRFSVAVALVIQFGRLGFQVFDGTYRNEKNALPFLSVGPNIKYFFYLF